MEYDYRYRAYPDRNNLVSIAERQLDIHRQAYNYTRYEYNHKQAQSNIGSAYSHQKRLTDWKDKFPIFAEVHSKALQKTVERFYKNPSRLKDKKEKGYKVGELKWKSPREYHVFAVWLQTQEHEWSEHEYSNRLVLKDWRYSHSLSPTDFRPRYYQRGHAQKRDDR
jgi:putative transposase